MKMSSTLFLAVALAVSPSLFADEPHRDDGSRDAKSQQEERAHHGDSHHGDDSNREDDSQSNTGSYVSGGLLGHFEGVVSFCADADPRSAAQYRSWMQKVTSGISERDLADARKGPEYRATFKGAAALLDSIPRGQRKQACSDMFSSI